MKLSLYSFLLSNKRGYYLFSTLFFSILQLDEKTFRFLQDCKTKGKDITASCIGEDLLYVLSENGFLSQSPEDEFKKFCKIWQDSRKDERDMHLTILPTLNCCFSCTYCFEKKKQSGFLSEVVMDSVIDYILRKKPDSLHITWFGGEPLLAIKQIETFTNKLDASFEGEYTSDIITTGFPVTGRVVDILKTSHIKEIQITIDGSKENHNRVKNTKDCSDTFTRVFNNIELITTSIPEIRCSIRVNVTRDNIADVPSLYSLVNERFVGKNVWLSPALVTENGVICSEQLFSSDEFRTISKRWWEQYRIPSKWIYAFDRAECAIRKPSSLVVIPDGSVCRCWEVARENDYNIGKLTKGGYVLFASNNTSFTKHLSKCDPFLNETCSKCAYLPICFGGCPIKSIKHIQVSGDYSPICTSYKDHLEEWLELYLDYCQQS